MDKKVLIENVQKECGALPIQEQAVLPADRIEFSEEVRHLCAVNYCGHYGTTWACPPAVGSVADCREKCLKFEHVYIVSTVHPLEDSFDLEGMEQGKAKHEKICSRIREIFKKYFPRNLMLTSEGCQNCASCTYPDSPCRFPDKMYPSVESYGISVVNEAAAAGMHYINGANTVTYFANIFF